MLLLLRCCQHHLSCASMQLAVMSSCYLCAHLSSKRALHPPFKVLEIASAAGCGRTTALLQIAVSCILPGPLGGIDYGGQAGAWHRLLP